MIPESSGSQAVLVYTPTVVFLDPQAVLVYTPTVAQHSTLVGDAAARARTRTGEDGRGGLEKAFRYLPSDHSVDRDLQEVLWYYGYH